MRSTLRVRLIAHVIGKRVQLLAKKGAELVRHRLFVERAIHAPQPLVALARADVKWKMPCAQARMSILLDVHGRTARPSGEVHIQLLTRRLEAGRVESPDRRRFGRCVHEVIEAIDELTNARVATDHLIRRGLLLVHRRYAAFAGCTRADAAAPRRNVPSVTSGLAPRRTGLPQ